MKNFLDLWSLIPDPWSLILDPWSLILDSWSLILDPYFPGNPRTSPLPLWRPRPRLVLEKHEATWDLALLKVTFPTTEHRKRKLQIRSYETKSQNSQAAWWNVYRSWPQLHPWPWEMAILHCTPGHLFFILNPLMLGLKGLQFIIYVKTFTDCHFPKTQLIWKCGACGE